MARGPQSMLFMMAMVIRLAMLVTPLVILLTRRVSLCAGATMSTVGLWLPFLGPPVL